MQVAFVSLNVTKKNTVNVNVSEEGYAHTRVFER